MIAYLKIHWKLFLSLLVVVIALIVVSALFYKHNNDQLAQFVELKKTTDVEIQKITAARDQENKQHVENEKRLNDALEQINTKYISAMKALNTRKREQVSAIIKTSEHNPDELAKQLSETTGFKVYTK